MKAFKFFSAILTIAVLFTAFTPADVTALCNTLEIENQNGTNSVVVTVNSNCGPSTYTVLPGATITPTFAGCAIESVDINGTLVMPCSTEPLPAPFVSVTVTCDFHTDCRIEIQ